ncbi:MAG: hypothetical protein ACJAV5_000097 [Vicingaceae bacterium]|jgi:hypothetical protein
MQTFLHYFLHFGFPFIIAFGFFRKDWKKVYLILIATMLVDIDHLLAEPIFESNRCSINFHPFHTYYAMVVYFALLFFRKPFNIIGIGLLFHMLTDFIDCLFLFSACEACFLDSPAIDAQKATSRFIHLFL